MYKYQVNYTYVFGVVIITCRRRNYLYLIGAINRTYMLNPFFFEGLYGNNGILPARTQMDLKETEFTAKLQKKPTLLSFAPYLGLDTEYMMDVLALFGMMFSFTGYLNVLL